MKDNKGNKTGSKSCVVCEKPVVNIDNEYVVQQITIQGDLVVVDTVAELRSLPQQYIQGLVSGKYKGVQLLGYYTKGDTPAPIEYYLSDTTYPDDGGSVFEVGALKLKHDFGGYVDVQYFGAKGDGVSDDTEYIQKSIDCLTSGVIYLPSKVFIVTVLRLKSNIEITGDGIGRSVIKRLPSIDVETWNNTQSLRRLSNIFTNWKYEGSFADNISINNITIDGSLNEVNLSNTSNMAPAWANIELCLVNNVSIYNVESINSIGDGFRANGCDNINVNNCLFKNNGYYVDGFSKNAISFRGREYVDQTAETILVAGNCSLTNCVVDTVVDEAVIVYRMGNCIISNNTFKNIGEYFIEFYGDNIGEDSDTKMIISNNLMENNGSFAMTFGESTFPVNILINDNIVKNVGKYLGRPVQQTNPGFIRSIYDTSNITIKNNIFESDSNRIGNGFIFSGEIDVSDNTIRISSTERLQSTLMSMTEITKASIKNNKIVSGYDSIVFYIRNNSLDISTLEVMSNNIVTNSSIAPGNSGVIHISKPTGDNVYRNVKISNNIFNHLNGNGLNITSGVFTNLSITSNIINASYRGITITQANTTVTTYVCDDNIVSETIITAPSMPYIQGNNFDRLSGTTAQRPTSIAIRGRQYFDATLGYTIWYNGTAWVDATGAVV